MKKILIIPLIMLVSMPVNAVCSITGGACSAPVNFESTNIRGKFVPDNLKNFQRTDAFQPKINNPADYTNAKPNNKNLKQNLESGSYEDDCLSGDCQSDN